MEELSNKGVLFIQIKLLHNQSKHKLSHFIIPLKKYLLKKNGFVYLKRGSKLSNQGVLFLLIKFMHIIKENINHLI